MTGVGNALTREALVERTGRELGGKARGLTDLQSAGFTVPPFVCSPLDIGEAVRSLGFPLAVRSSASVEDGTTLSFAGQFSSFLNLRSFDEVHHAAAQCRASVRAPSVLEYCRHNGIAPESLRMEVIIQRMVQPDLAGVAFTVCPVTGREEVVIEACEGPSSELLAGHTAPLPGDHPLVARYRDEIERVARKIQRHYGRPQDIEFAIESGTLYILQTRPITRIAFAPTVGEWTNADFRDGGVSSDVCTPLMWSLYDFIWEDTLKRFLRELKLLRRDFRAGRMFFGRPYWNLGEVKQCLTRLPGFVEREFDEDLGVAPTYPGVGRRTPVNPFTVVRALPSLFAIDAVWKKQERFDAEFLAGGFADLAARYETRPPDPVDALSSLIHDAYRTTESNYFRTIFCASLAKLDFMASYPDAPFPALLAALPPLSHLAPTRAMLDMMERGETDVTPLLTRFRHRSRRELDIRVPRWDEDRPWVEELMQHCASQPRGDPQQAYDQAYAGSIRKLARHRRAGFKRKLERVRRFVWLREEMRDLSSQMYYLIRKHVLAVARRRGLGDHIFFMTFQEILADDRSAIERNRAIYDSYRNFEPPNEIGFRFASAESSSQGELRGVGASPGTTTGVARVVRSVEEAARVEQDAILICPFTDPGWTPVLNRVSAVVTEAGGLLSHAAVICREYGIPAVLGVPRATARIKDGVALTVNGGTGSITIEE